MIAWAAGAFNLIGRLRRSMAISKKGLNISKYTSGHERLARYLAAAKAWRSSLFLLYQIPHTNLHHEALGILSTIDSLYTYVYHFVLPTTNACTYHWLCLPVQSCCPTVSLVELHGNIYALQRFVPAKAL